MGGNCSAMKITFIAIGDELLLGETQESNGTHLSQVLSRRGLRLSHSQILPDVQERISESLRGLASEEGLIVVSGGLGPTDDDRTREAVAQALNVPLVCHEELKEALANRKSSLTSTVSKSNLRQSYAPEGAKVLKNPVGTAPCFVATLDSSLIFCLPGVPREFKKLIETYLDELLEEMGAEIQEETESLFKIFGEAESTLQDRLLKIPHYDQVQVRSLPKFPEIWLRIKPDGSQETFDLFTRQLAEELGWRAFSQDPEGTYAGTLVEELKEANATLSLAESCTGGLMAHMITSVVGSSAVFWGGAVVYANEAKEKMLGVSEETIREAGAVSEEVSLELALGLRREYGTTLGLAVTGIAGPGGGSDEKPVGTVFLALSSPDGNTSWRYNFPPMGRQRIQQLTAYVGLGKIRSWLGKRS
jgi:nicotinamide-nucleotide amidase